MTTPDFSKIWATNSSLTPYSFSDDDYLDGWEFIGEIPPDRRMFDAWQKQTDTKMQWLFQNAAYLVRQNSTEYEVGDIAFTPSLPSSFFLKCIDDGTTAATEPDFSGATIGGKVTDGTVVWQYYDLLSGSGVPLGSILPYSANAATPPYGFLYCEGQAVSRTMYTDLFNLIGTTYGAGDGSTTFNLPNLVGKYPQGDTTAGTVKSAGLPNITVDQLETATLYGPNHPNGEVVTNGAIRYTFYANTNVTSGSYDKAANMDFDASLSNPIYGNSDTVTPPTLTVRWIIKAYDAPTPSSAQIDLSQYASDLANRLTREQTPAFNRRDVITSSGTYTAPVTGWYKITVKGGGGGGQGGGYSSTQSKGGNGGGEGGTSIGYEKMTAGQTATVVIGAGGTGGAASTSGTTGTPGGNGGNTTVTVNGHSYVGGGSYAGTGGSGTIQGTPGTATITTDIVGVGYGASGGGNGAGRYGGSAGVGANGQSGGGGAGGFAQHGGSALAYAGGNGGDGYAWFEYFDPSLN